jgi:DNA-binding XRE family transcriptional regulator
MNILKMSRNRTKREDKLLYLRKMREKAGVAQVDAAKRIGVSNNTLCQYESGTRKTPSALLPKLAKLYGCKIEDFYGREELEER